MTHHRSDGAESQIRTGDTAIFSRVLYQLSYLGPMANQPAAVRRRSGGYHERSTPGQRRPGRPVPYSRPARVADSAWASGASPVNSRRRLMRSMIAGWVDIRFDERASNFLMGFVK